VSKLDRIAAKILSWDDISRRCAVWRLQEKKVVFTNGCFDILHLGHVEYLSKAADLGNILVIGMNTDRSTQHLKGPHRPINDEHARAMLLAALSFVDVVVLFDEETPYELIRHIQPDILVKGKDYSVEQIAGHDIVLARGGRVETIELTEGYSTTKIEQKILGSAKQ
jgi:D-glycero-beta-D-manno-heptose 1-phosphate adenylyltransferase